MALGNVVLGHVHPAAAEQRGEEEEDALVVGVGLVAVAIVGVAYLEGLGDAVEGAGWDDVFPAESRIRKWRFAGHFAIGDADVRYRLVGHHEVDCAS